MVACTRVMVTKMKGCVQISDMSRNKSADGSGIEQAQRKE